MQTIKIKYSMSSIEDQQLLNNYITNFHYIFVKHTNKYIIYIMYINKCFFLIYKNQQEFNFDIVL